MEYTLMDKITSLREHCNNTYIVEKASLKIKYNSELFISKKNKMGASKQNTIIFVKGDTLKTAIKYNNYDPLILIFADNYVPGGTWVSNCQEEVLFRRSALFAHLPTTLYPIAEREILLAKDVAIFNIDPNDYKPLNYNNILYKFDFIALPCVKNYNGEKDVYLILRDKIRLLFQTCIMYDYKTIILGAIGCGAYGCNPKNIAEVFKEVQVEYEHCGLTIIYSFIGSINNIFFEKLR